MHAKSRPKNSHIYHSRKFFAVHGYRNVIALCMSVICTRVHLEQLKPLTLGVLCREVILYSESPISEVPLTAFFS